MISALVFLLALLLSWNLNGSNRVHHLRHYISKIKRSSSSVLLFDIPSARPFLHNGRIVSWSQRRPDDNFRLTSLTTSAPTTTRLYSTRDNESPPPSIPPNPINNVVDSELLALRMSQFKESLTMAFGEKKGTNETESTTKTSSPSLDNRFKSQLNRTSTTNKIHSGKANHRGNNSTMNKRTQVKGTGRRKEKATALSADGSAVVVLPALGEDRMSRSSRLSGHTRMNREKSRAQARSWKPTSTMDLHSLLKPSSFASSSSSSSSSSTTKPDITFRTLKYDHLASNSLKGIEALPTIQFAKGDKYLFRWWDSAKKWDLLSGELKELDEEIGNILASTATRSGGGVQPFWKGNNKTMSGIEKDTDNELEEGLEIEPYVTPTPSNEFITNENSKIENGLWEEREDGNDIRGLGSRGGKERRNERKCTTTSNDVRTSITENENLDSDPRQISKAEIDEQATANSLYDGSSAQVSQIQSPDILSNNTSVIANSSVSNIRKNVSIDGSNLKDKSWEGYSASKKSNFVNNATTSGTSGSGYHNSMYSASTLPSQVQAYLLSRLYRLSRYHKARVICIGDVHGCVDELCDLIRAVEYKPGDTVLLLGDLVAKGPFPVQVVRMAMDIGALSVRGNHGELLFEDNVNQFPRCSHVHMFTFFTSILMSLPPPYIIYV